MSTETKLLPEHKMFDHESYQYKELLPTWPKYNYDPHVELDVKDKGLLADPEMKALLGAATHRDDLTPALGTVLDGIDIRQLSDDQKNELALLTAQRGVVVFHKQEATIHEMIKLAEYFGPLHVHSTTGIPEDPALKGAHVVWNDGTKPQDWINFNRDYFGWHSDQTYEINPPSLTSLKVVTAPKTGGDTLWASGYAVFSSFSPQFQRYLETLSALHSSDMQKQLAIQRGVHIRRPQTDCIHPVVRVHPVTGMKFLFINTAYTRQIVGVPKAESDAILAFLFSQVSACTEYQCRVRWGKDTICFWDNRCCWHTATFDFYPMKRHGLRVMPMGEKPMSVEQYEAKTGKKAKDWYKEKMRLLGEEMDD
ncbi:TauD-domain-containing protein [Dacryopinax primogenitus]|uniref:TauD-domain-containing protein n=1 Tax=Dacryopinax primogenitus (strain DJM 731) TaxID=1858805 RepID=M5FS33_DACPD|nr:TauD-domain-containing protein [Dacryopinax primogenitus]EJT97934.1 TauD-domain-containing protein [Dacryopinax primogenitus]